MMRANRVPARFRRRGFTLVELLLVVAIVGLLSSIALPSLSEARRRTREVKCLTNLHNIGGLIHAFANTHDDYVAPTIRDQNYHWDHGKQIGWDIQTGRWGNAPGGEGSMWECPQQSVPYVGNARTLGVDNRETLSYGLLHQVGPRQWRHTSRLVLAYDFQNDLLYMPFNAWALVPNVADLDDRAVGGWEVNPNNPFIGLYLPHPTGPHRGAYSILFADGHACVMNSYTAADALWWAGMPWWRPASGFCSR